MPQIFDATANENARYKRNELELSFKVIEEKNVKCKYSEWTSCISVYS